MIDYTELLNIPPYSLGKEQKHQLLTELLRQLTVYHDENCPEYHKILSALQIQPGMLADYAEIPFLPVRLFKEYELYSVPKERIIKTMTSSGTSGQQVSKIFLDRETSANQTRVLTKIVSSFLGTARLPMIIIDTPSVIRNRAMFSARGAGILGFQMFGRDRIFALDDDMNLNLPELTAFLEKHAGETVFLFGFTFMIWEHFVQKLRHEGIRLGLNDSVLIHGGGWKKLADRKISSDVFRSALAETAGISRIHDYYGMAEQTGSVCMECECGHLHTSIFSDILIRRAQDFSVCEPGEKGLIQVLSVLAGSYPGHSLLTEDEGVLLGEDDCPCGRKGKYFKVLGRIANAEIRGCSDTYAEKFR